jgi:hypothetical protein
LFLSVIAPLRAQSRPVGFLRDVAPILTERGCTGSNCHGSVRGKADFKLSLFGGKPDADYEAIVKASDGRRIDRNDPVQSLLLKKATFQVPHGGGLRFPVNSPAFETVRAWIANGMPYDNGGPDLGGVHVRPEERVLAGIGAKQQLSVTGHFTDGTTADMTRKVRYSSNDDSVAAVDDNGLITAKRAGETAVMIRTLGRTAVVRIAVTEKAIQPRAIAETGNFIDRHVNAKLARLGIEQSAAVSDTVLVRRLYLDTIGVLPAIDETREFLASSDSNKRAKLIDALLERPEFAELWAMRFADLYQLGWSGLKGGTQLHRWIRKSLVDHKPYDQMVREMILGTGSFVYEPTVNFYSGMFTGPEGMVTMVAQSMLGVRMDCAKCHDHPWENWTRDDFYGMAAFFTRLVRKAEPYGLFEHAIVIRPDGKPTYDYVNNNKELVHPKTRAPLQPRFLDGGTAEFRPNEDIREKLADWLTSPKNPWFTKAIANRVWRHYMGRALVEPVDDFRITNPPSNPALLDALAEHLVRERFQLRGLARAILNSRTYQTSAMPYVSNKSDTINYSRYYPKRLMAEVLFDAMGQAAEARQKLPGSPPGERSIHVAVGSPNYFLTTFGKVGLRDQICERDHESNVAQAMHLINGDSVQSFVTARGNIVERVLAKTEWDDARRIADIYMAALARIPTETELAESRRHLAVTTDSEARKKVFQDLLWAILNSKEFAHVF